MGSLIVDVYMSLTNNSTLCSRFVMKVKRKKYYCQENINLKWWLKNTMIDEEYHISSRTSVNIYVQNTD